MRLALLCSIIVSAPVLAHADPQCVLPAPPVTSAGSAGQVAGEVGLQLNHPAPRAPGVPTFNSDPVSGVSSAKALDHVMAAGAQVTEAGTSHGLRAVIARNAGEFMRFYVTPDGQALVAGLMSDLSVENLYIMAAGQATELGSLHGLRGIFVRNGSQFQVFYATPDRQRVIPGAMFDAQGHNLTRGQVSIIPGVVPTVVIGGADPRAAAAAQDGPASPLRTVEAATYGTVGSTTAPRLWVFIDPLCAWSVRAMEQLRPYVASGRLQLAVVPVSVLDHEDDGRSTVLAKAMLSLPQDEMVAAWGGNKLNNSAEPVADQRLAANLAVANAIGLRGTPTLVWRKADGGEGRADGLPSDLDALVASIRR